MIKIWFFWTPEIARRVLEDLLNDKRFLVDFVVTSPDKPVWRSQIMTPTPVKSLSISRDIMVMQPHKVKWNGEFLKALKERIVDYFVVVAYWKILPNEILNLPNKMCVNVHASILPLYRWASPIQSALINWETVTWVTIMKMSEGMDEWDIIDIQKLDINKFDTSEILFNKFEQISWKFLADTLVAYDENKRWLIKQVDEAATYCKKITKEDWLLDFKRSAENLFYLWRWVTPWPWAFTMLEWKKLIIVSCDYSDIDYDGKIWEVIKTPIWVWIKCSKWIFILKVIKLEGKQAMSIEIFLNWRKDFIWKILY